MSEPWRCSAGPADLGHRGLRYGGSCAFRVADVELERGVIHVRVSWDEGAVAPKSVAGERRVSTRECCSASSSGICEPRLGGRSLRPHADRAVRLHGPERPRSARLLQAGLEAITPHEARPTYASLMIAAGTPLKELAEYMGHGSIAINSTGTGACSKAHQDAERRLDGDQLSKLSFLIGNARDHRRVHIASTRRVGSLWMVAAQSATPRFGSSWC